MGNKKMELGSDLNSIFFYSPFVWSPLLRFWNSHLFIILWVAILPFWLLFLICWLVLCLNPPSYLPSPFFNCVLFISFVSRASIRKKTIFLSISCYNPPHFSSQFCLLSPFMFYLVPLTFFQLPPLLWNFWENSSKSSFCNKIMHICPAILKSIKYKP